MQSSIRVKVKLKPQLPPEPEFSKPPFCKKKVVGAIAIACLGLTGLVQAVVSEDAELSGDRLVNQVSVNQASVNPVTVQKATSKQTVTASVMAPQAELTPQAEPTLAEQHLEQSRLSEQAGVREQALVVSDNSSEVDSSSDVDSLNQSTTSSSQVADTGAEPKAPESAQLDASNSSIVDDSAAEQPVLTTAANNPDVVGRLVLSDKIINKEPNQSFSDAIPVQPGRFSLYLFTELNDYQGEQVSHRWYFNDKLMADIQLPIKAKTWRTWSSKRILWHWQGDWRVELIDQNGEPLAVRHFKYGINL